MVGRAESSSPPTPAKVSVPAGGSWVLRGRWPWPQGSPARPSGLHHEGLHLCLPKAVALCPPPVQARCQAMMRSWAGRTWTGWVPPGLVRMRPRPQALATSSRAGKGRSGREGKLPELTRQFRGRSGGARRAPPSLAASGKGPPLPLAPGPHRGPSGQLPLRWPRAGQGAALAAPPLPRIVQPGTSRPPPLPAGQRARACRHCHMRPPRAAQCEVCGPHCV